MKPALAYALALVAVLLAVGSRADSMPSCPSSIPDYSISGGRDSNGNLIPINAPPQPYVSITYDSATQLPTFKIDAQYMRNNYVYLVDFYDLSLPTQPTEAQVEAALRGSSRSCANREIVGGTFASLTTSAADTQATDALGTATNGAYYDIFNSWTITALNGTTCANAVTMRLAESFTHLYGCTGPVDNDANNGILVQTTTRQSDDKTVTEYSGNLYIHILAPIDPTDAAAGIVHYRYKYPFKYQVLQSLEVFGPITAEFSVDLEALGMSQTANIFTIKVRTVTTGETLVSALGVSACPSTYGTSNCGSKVTVTDVTSVGCPGTTEAPCYHYFSIAIDLNDKTAEDLSGTWELTLTDAEGGNSVFQLVLSRTTTITTTVNDVVFETALKFFDSSAAWLAATPSSSGLEDSKVSGGKLWLYANAVVNEEDWDFFTTTIDDAYTCLPVSGYTPSLDNGGCTASAANFRNKVQLVTAGAATSGLPGYNVQDVNAALLNSVASGFSMSTAPLGSFGSGQVHYFHLKVSVVGNGLRKRSIQYLFADGAGVNPTEGMRYVVFEEPRRDAPSYLPMIVAGTATVVGGAIVICGVVVGTVMLRQSYSTPVANPHQLLADSV